VLCGTYISLRQEYGVTVTLARRVCVKAQDSYLSSSQMRASYPTNYLPLGRNASLVLRRGKEF
jgi:hypothetical protein